jgi:hypothetical protein
VDMKSQVETLILKSELKRWYLELSLFQ